MELKKVQKVNMSTPVQNVLNEQVMGNHFLLLTGLLLDLFL